MRLRLSTRLGAILTTAAAAVTGLAVAAPASAAPPALYGPIHDEYWSLGGPSSFLGQRTTGVEGTVDGLGYFADFQGGRITYRRPGGAPGTGAPHVIRGAILSRFFTNGAVRGLAYPEMDEVTLRGGSYQDFGKGAIYSSPTGGAHEVSGAVDATWAGTDWEQGPLGYPTSEEGVGASVDGDVGTFQHFQNGAIYNQFPDLYPYGDDSAYEIIGPIYAYFAGHGFERTIGYPEGDRDGYPCYVNGNDAGTEYVQVFDHGTLYQAPSGQVTTTDPCD